MVNFTLEMALNQAEWKKRMHVADPKLCDKGCFDTDADMGQKF